MIQESTGNPRPRSSADFHAFPVAPGTDSGDASPARRGVGILRILVGLLVLAVTQISDQLVNDAFVAEEYFSYFTIQTSLMNVVVLLAGGAWAMQHAHAVSYPLAWVAFTLMRGALTGWYPYPFLDPGGPEGWRGVALYVLGIAVFIVAIASAAIIVSRFAPSRPRSSLESSDG